MEPHCDACHTKIVTRGTTVRCQTCKATFCNAKCKKNAKKQHKKCSGRQHWEPKIEKPEIEDVRVRSILFGPRDEHQCGYRRRDGSIAPATTPERANQVMADFYQRHRDFFISFVAKDAESRSKGLLSIQFDGYFDFAQRYIDGRPPEPEWSVMDKNAIEKTKILELGEDYFGLRFVIKTEDGEVGVDRILRFLYNGITE